MNWINIKYKKPAWYSNVELKVDGNVEQHWHRLLGDNEDVYYGSLETNKIIPEEEVSHWRQLKDKSRENIKFHKYD